MQRRKPVEKPGLAFSVVVGLLRPLVIAIASREYRGAEKLPAGGALLVFNHNSYFDPLVTGLFVYDQGHVPRYLVKEALFRNRLLRRPLLESGQIPVARMTSEAISAYSAAVNALGEGKLVGVYPEGTITRDPGLWPMRGKTGAARIALATGAPVIPIGHWGAQDVLPPYAKKPRFFPRKHVVVQVGDPVDLSELMGSTSAEPSTEQVAAATDRIMASLVEIVEELRGEKAPAERFDPRREGVAQIGNPTHAPKDGHP